MNETFDIHELSAQSAAELGPLEQESGRVSDVPSTRTIRYYTQLGILSPPLRFDGRTAIYGRKHLAQLVAIKRLQIQGLSLREVQAELTGIDDNALESLSHISINTVTNKDTIQRSRREFWTEAPAEVSASSEREVEEQVVSDALRFDDNAALVLEGLTRHLTQSDRAAIEAAAGPLLKVLRTRNLVLDHKRRNP